MMQFLEFAFASPARYFGLLIYLWTAFICFAFTLGLIVDFWKSRGK